MDCCRITGIVFVISMITGIVCLASYTIPHDRAAYYGKYVPDTFLITGLSQGGYSCCQKQNCQCIDTTAPYCGTMINNLQSGICGDGPWCCNYDSHGNCRAQVLNEQCYVSCGTCHNPVIYASYFKDSVLINGSSTSHCAMDDMACVNAFFGSMHVGQTVEGMYNVNNPNDIQFHGLHYVISGGIIAGFVLLSIILCFSCCCVFVPRLHPTVVKHTAWLVDHPFMPSFNWQMARRNNTIDSQLNQNQCQIQGHTQGQTQGQTQIPITVELPQVSKLAQPQIQMQPQAFYMAYTTPSQDKSYYPQPQSQIQSQPHTPAVYVYPTPVTQNPTPVYYDHPETNPYQYGSNTIYPGCPPIQSYVQSPYQK